MDFFTYKDAQLFAEDVAVADIAKAHGTPVYIYSRATIERHWHAFNNAVAKHDHLICYAVKANSNLGVLSVLAKLGSGLSLKPAAIQQKWFFLVSVKHRKKFVLRCIKTSCVLMLNPTQN